jgi:predicted nucleic acid-binding protein
MIDTRRKNILIDTNIIVYLSQNNRNTQQTQLFLHQFVNTNYIYVSAITVGEIKVFADTNGWGQKRIDKLLNIELITNES